MIGRAHLVPVHPDLVMATILGAALPVLAEGPREVDRVQNPPVEW